MEAIDINKVKIAGAHTGLVEIMVILRNAYTKINEVIEDEQLKEWPKMKRTLGDMSDLMCDCAGEVSEMTGMLFFIGVNQEIDKLQKQ